MATLAMFKGIFIFQNQQTNPKGKQTMKTLITRIKRVALALCLATPIVSWAVTTTDYEQFGDTAGVVLWRGEGSTFHNDKVIDVAADGTEGEAYAMTANHSATSWQRFAIGQSAYSAPGKVLVYDVSGKTAASDAQFSQISFGGMWVKVLAAEETPYSITGSGTRYTDFGNSGYTTYFVFDKSYTVNRASATRCYGNVNVSVASGETFTSQASMWIEANSTLAFSGEGEVVLPNGLYMNSSSTLDLSAITRPTITGNVTFPAGATLALPSGTKLDEDVEIEICSGTVTVSGIIKVKVGDADAVETIVTTSEGKITRIDTGITYTADFPTTVPAGSIYTYVGGETAEGAVEIDGVTVNGKLKTQGYVNLTGLTVNNGGTLEVVDGNTTATAATNGYGDKLIDGNLIVRAGATLTTTQSDFLDWYGATSQTLDIYGTLALGNTRWSVKAAASCTINFYPGARVTGNGDANGVLDLIAADSKLNVYPGANGGEVVIEGVVKTRNANTPIWIGANTTLKIGGLRGGGVNKSGNGTLEISGTVESPAASTVSEGTIAFVNTTVAVPLTVNAGKTVTASASEGVTVPLNVTMNASANITVSGAGTVNGTLTYSGVPSGTLTGLTTSTWEGTVVLGALNAPAALPLNNLGNVNSKIVLTGTTGNCYLNGTTTVAAEVVVGTDENSVVEFNNGNSNQVGTFSKVSGPGTLKLVGWTGCSAATYVLSTLDNFEGLAIANNITRDGGGTFTVRIGNIVTTRTTNPGDCVLPIANTAVDNATGTVVYDLANAQVNGNTLDLEAKEDGIYVAVPAPTTVEITVTPVTGATASVTADGQAVEIVAGKVTVDIGAAVVVTYTANAGYVVTGSPVEFTATAETTAVDTSTVTSDAIVAVITDANSDTWSYTDIATAFAEVEDGDTLTLVGTAVTLATDVTVETSYTLAGDAEGTTVTGAGKIYLTGSAALTLDATLTSVGNQFWFSSKDATLTFPTEGFKPSVRPYTAGGCQTGTTVNGDGTTTYYQYLFLTLQVGATNVTLAYADTEDPLVMKQVYEGDEIVFTATPAEGYENVVVTVNGDTQTPVDGKYTVVVGTVNVVIQATATAMPKVAEIVGGDQYTSLGAAIAAATDGDTVKLLADVTLEARVDVNVGAGTTITIDLGENTITTSATCLNGSAFNIQSGTVTITNGSVIGVEGPRGEEAYECDVITVRSGAEVVVSAMTITIDSRNGACVYPFTGAKATILSGTYANTTKDAYQYKAAWTGMAVNQGNVATQLLFIKGGTFSQVNPALGDDSWEAGTGTFLANGYQSTETSTGSGVWVVTEKQGIDPEDPTSTQEVTPSEQEIADAGSAEAAAKAKATVTVPEDVATATGVTEETYKSYFTLSATETSQGSGVYEVAVVGLNEAVVFPTEESDDLTADLADVLDVDAGADVEITTAKPGLYYSIEAANSVDFATGKVEGARELATTTTVSPAKPAKTGTAVFYRVKVSVTAE